MAACVPVNVITAAPLTPLVNVRISMNVHPVALIENMSPWAIASGNVGCIAQLAPGRANAVQRAAQGGVEHEAPGRITRIDYRPGKFLPAYDEGSNDNELNELWIDSHGRTVVVRQVVGILARRIVCRVVEGQELARGERIGLMKFGSRMDVFLPPDAELRVSVGERTVAGETVLATMGSAGAR